MVGSIVRFTKGNAIEGAIYVCKDTSVYIYLKASPLPPAPSGCWLVAGWLLGWLLGLAN